MLTFYVFFGRLTQYVLVQRRGFITWVLLLVVILARQLSDVWGSVQYNLMCTKYVLCGRLYWKARRFVVAQYCADSSLGTDSLIVCFVASASTVTSNLEPNAVCVEICGEVVPVRNTCQKQGK
jgi:hypothetical protein